MKRQVNALLALAGTAVLLGCTQDEVGMAPGGFEPSSSSEQSEDDSPGGRSRGGSNGGGGY